MTACSVPNCLRKQYRRGICTMHYGRLSRGLSLDNSGSYSRSSDAEERLRFHGWTERLVVSELGPCWEWNGSKRKGGYGRISIGGKGVVVTRLAYETWVGPIPKGVVIRHRCDNPPCINPEHLEVGTYQDNTQDMINRKRDNPRRGTASPNAKLDELQILQVLSRYKTGESQQVIANDLGVSQTLISRILLGKCWTHVTGRNKWTIKTS